MRRLGLVWLAVVLASPVVAWWVARIAGWPLRALDGWGLWWPLLGSPLLEEVVYRAGIQRPVSVHLEASRPDWAPLQSAWVANGVATLCFVCVHMPAQGWVALAWVVPAWVLGELFRQAQRVWPCVALHAWFNASLWWASR